MKILNEPIEIKQKRFNFSPGVFVWRGRSLRVNRVHKHWMHVPILWGQGRHYFRVLCHNGRVYEVYQDTNHNTWHLARAVSDQQFHSLGRLDRLLAAWRNQAA